MHIFSTKARITALVLFSFPQYHEGKKSWLQNFSVFKILSVMVIGYKLRDRNENTVRDIKEPLSSLLKELLLNLLKMV